VTPDDAHTRQVTEEVTATTGGDGTVSVSGLSVGEYVARLDFPSDATVETEPASMSVTAGDSTTATVSASFAFTIGDRQRERIDQLHRDISDLTPSNRDGAIPYYSGSVLSAVLMTVDEFPDSGVAFVRHGVDPDAITDATIDAVAAAVDYTQDAMTNRKNSDLFSACRGLRDARTKWDGDVTVEQLLSMVADEKANHRGELIDRLEDVEALLSTKQNEVTTVTPARDQYQAVRDHATELRGLSSVEQRVHFFVGLQMLDAVESLFDHPELVDRLEETVF
jgi:hypothetical protein